MVGTTSRWMAGIGVAALVSLGLAGCATSPDSDADSTGQDTQDPGAGGDIDVEIEVDAAWLAGGGAIAIVTQGSSSCPPQVEDLALESDGTLAVVINDPVAEGELPCTRDLAPRGTLVGLPEGVDPTQDLSISVSGPGQYGSTTLAGVPGLERPADLLDDGPSAGWTSVPGEFVVLTYGSSSCVPVVEEVTATGDDTATLRFETPPADQVCTADFAPRVTMAFVDGLADTAGVELTLEGENLDGTTIPIIGTP